LVPPITPVSKAQYEKYDFPFEESFVEEGGWGDRENAEVVDVEIKVEVGDETVVDEEEEEMEEEMWESGEDDSDSDESRVSIGGTYLHRREKTKGEDSERVDGSGKIGIDGTPEGDGKGSRPRRHKREKSRKSGGSEDVQSWVNNTTTPERKNGVVPGESHRRKSSGGVPGGILKFEGQEGNREKRKSNVSFVELPRHQLQDEKPFSEKRKSCSLVDLPKLLLPQEERSFVVQRRENKGLGISGRAKERDQPTLERRMTLDE